MAISTMQRHISSTTLRTLSTSGLALLNLGLMLTACRWAGCWRAVRRWPGDRSCGNMWRPTATTLPTPHGASGMTGQLITGVAKLQVAGAEDRAFASWSQTFCQQQQVRQRLQGTDTMTVINAVLPTLASWCSSVPSGCCASPPHSRREPLWLSMPLSGYVSLEQRA
jgi:ATP-binding cassette subfamily C protein